MGMLIKDYCYCIRLIVSPHDKPFVLLGQTLFFEIKYVYIKKHKKTIQ
jgi:hypothetical protein